ncbi:hypothetical protein ACF0H5_017126 [Mactra antiquata]
MVNTLFNLSESKQIQSNLKSVMASMTALSHSKHSQLEELDKAQVKALEDITTLQTALEAFLKKAADKSRQAVKDIFKKLEDRVFQQQIDIANINDVLNNVAEKIDRAEANRAQLFSCMKVAERKIKDAEKKKFKLGMDDNPDLPLLFIPDQSLLSYLKGLQDIGEVNRYVTFNNSGTKMYVTDLDKGVVCFDSNGRYLTTFTDAELQGARGACVDADGNVFVCGIDSHNVVQFNEDGIKIGVILKQQNGLHHPRSVCFHQGLNKLFVTMADSDVIKMYELE